MRPPTAGAVAAITFALFDNGFGFRTPIGCQRAPDINLLAGELAPFSAAHITLVAAVWFYQFSWHDDLL
jgi:hypothetical protein